MGTSGSSFRQERERKGIKLEDISMSTKVAGHYLLAIENDQLDQLPGGIIGRGFVRAYAKYVGIDDQDALEEFSAARTLCETAPEPEPEPRIKKSYDQAMALPSWVLAAAFVAIGLGGVELGLVLHQHTEFFRAALATEADPSISVVSNSSVLASKGDEARQAARSSEVIADKETAVLMVKPDTESEQGGPSLVRSSVGNDFNFFSLQINTRQDAWISIIADGQPILSKIVTAPDQRVVKAHSRILVRAGNIGAVDFSFNGEPLPSQGNYDEAKTIFFDANGLQAEPPNIVSFTAPDSVSTITPVQR